MVEKILNNTTPYGKIRASHEGSLHSSTLNNSSFPCIVIIKDRVKSCDSQNDNVVDNYFDHRF